MRHIFKSCLFSLMSVMAFGQVPPPEKPSHFEGKKHLNEVDNKNGVISNIMYSDNILTKEYKRYQADSLGYIRDSLQYVRLQQIAPIKQNGKNKN